MITPDRCLIFPSVEYVRHIVNKQGTQSNLPVVIDCSYIYGADFTAANVVGSLIKDFEMRKQLLVFLNLKASVGQIFDEIGSGLQVVYNEIGLDEAIFQGNENKINDVI